MGRCARAFALCFLIAAAGSAGAQQQTVACNRICWTRATHSATCSSKVSQAELTAYIYSVQHNAIAKGKSITFHLDLGAQHQSCASPVAKSQAVSVIGYVNVRSVTGFTIGSLKAGDTIEISGDGVEDNEENVMFYPALDAK